MVPEAKPDVYAARRREFMKRMQGGVAVVQGAGAVYRYRDLAFPYRQDSDMLYLTGFQEPSSACLLMPEHPEHQFVLFVQERDGKAERWDGPRAGVEGALEQFGADAAYPIESLHERLAGYLEGVSTLYYQLGHRESFDLELLRMLRAQPPRKRSIQCLRDAGVILAELRSRKDGGEVERLRRAGEVTAAGLAEAVRQARPGRFEYELKAVLDYEFGRQGAAGHAFDPIVATGEHATVLHYGRYDGRLAEGELLLLDAGAEHGGYVSDCSRTVPVGGRFTTAQRRVYECVLEAQQEALARVRPGVRFRDVHEAAVEAVAAGLVELEVLEGPVGEAVESRSYERFFMHRTSHWIGLDIRDPFTAAGDEQVLEAGMSLTVEPGLYFPPESDPPAEFAGIGVRIEDSVVVTGQGCEVLTAAVPKDAAGLERLCTDTRAS